eukprot:scaffold3.g6494.t1
MRSCSPGCHASRIAGPPGDRKGAEGLPTRYASHTPLLPSGFQVLSTGEEVKLQRNALQVLEYPTGNEPVRACNVSRSQGVGRGAAVPPHLTCHLARRRLISPIHCLAIRLAQQDFSEDEDEEEQRRQQQQRQQAMQASSVEQLDKPRQRRPPWPAIEDAGVRRLSQRGAGAPRINLHKLDTAALKRYRAFYDLADAGPNPTKDDLVHSVEEHFTAQARAARGGGGGGEGARLPAGGARELPCRAGCAAGCAAECAARAEPHALARSALSRPQEVDEQEVIDCFLRAAKRHNMGLLTSW